MKRTALFVAALTLAACQFLPAKRNPFHPALGDPSTRKAVFAAEFAKHPEAPGCATFKEISVNTTGKRSIWTLECGDGLQVNMYVESNGTIVGSEAVGHSKSSE